MQKKNALEHQAPRRALAWLRATMWLAALVPLLLFAIAAWYLHGQAISEAQWRVDRAARVGEEHALKVFETNIALLERVGDALGSDSEETLRARQLPLYEALVRMTADLKQLQGLFVMGPSGRMIANNRIYPAPAVDVTDRAFFRHHLAGGAQPFVTEVLTSRTTGELFFDMSVRRTGADGRVSAVLSASMAPRYFAEFYRELADGRQAVHVALMHSDGSVLAGWPETALTAADAGERVAAERRVGAYPVRVAAWMLRAQALAPWYRQLGLLAAFGFPSALALIYVAWVALQRTKRSIEVAQQLQEETALRQQVEDSLRQTQKLEALGRLGGGVAHDFNNLLMVIANNVYLHRRLQPSVAASPQLAAIERAVAGGSKLTRQLLSFARRQMLRPERVRLQEHLPTMQALLAPAVGAAIHVELHSDADTAAVEVDVAELELALINLAINARDAMPAGGTLRVEAGNAANGEPSGLEGRFVVIRVQDDGSGIAPELLDRVFEPFFTTKPVGEGTGLGLSQVYGFCARAGGLATLNSLVGKGTTVSLYLPVASAMVQVPRAAAPEAPAVPPTLEGVRVLLVEDNADVASTTATMLESMGCAVRPIENADLAIALLQTSATQFDVVLSDIVMGGTQDGIGLAARLMADHPQLPVLLISGYSASLDSAIAMGVHVLPKPCTPQALASAIGQVLARRAEPA